MMIWTAKDAARATGGQVFSSWQAGKIVFDSRLVEPGDFFLALSAGQSNGHDYLENAFANGAAAAIVETIPANMSCEKLLHVADSLSALNAMANYKRAKSKAIFIAITGSVGKTSSKEMLLLALEPHGKVFASRGNYNNYLGVPINIASIPDDLQYAVIEIGMDHEGEITPLTNLVKPNITIITSIEEIHLANFTSIEGIASAKAEIFSGLQRDGIAVINSLSNCYESLRQYALDIPNCNRIISIGKNSKILNYKIQQNQTQALLIIDGQEIEITLDNIVGIHQIHNILAVLTLIDALELDLFHSIDRMKDFKLPKGRGLVSKIQVDNKEITLIDDSYNSGPVSVRAAIKNIANYHGRKIVILGDMTELGPNSLNIHLSLKEDLIANNIDKVICFGEQMKHLYEILPNSQRCAHYLKLTDLAIGLPSLLEDGDILLIKGSFYLTKLYYFTQHLRAGTLDAL